VAPVLSRTAVRSQEPGSDKTPEKWEMIRPVMPRSGAVLLLGNYRPTICLVRELHALDYRTIVGRGGGEGGAEYSRFTDETWDHPPCDGDGFIRALAALLGHRPDITVVFPVGEAFVRAVAAARDRLPADRVYAIPAAAVVEATLDKVAAYALAGSVDVPVAPYAVVDSPAALRARCATIGYPLALRPLGADGLAGEKAVILASDAELDRVPAAWTRGRGCILAQRYVTGRRHNLYFAARKGRLVRLLEAVIERTDRLDDTGLAVEGRSIEPTPDLARYTERLAAALDYTGVGCAQFLVDPRSGAASFLEVNARIAGNHAIAEAGGLELGALSITLAATDPPDVPFVRGRPGLHYAWTYGDLRGLVGALASGLAFRAALRWALRLLRALFTTDVHVTWRWDDPLPTLVLYARSIGLFSYRLRRRSALPRFRAAADPSR
jgi:predicted ATP-grasp superfamily ATP-dependent carboligase